MKEEPSVPVALYVPLTNKDISCLSLKDFNRTSRERRSLVFKLRISELVFPKGLGNLTLETAAFFFFFLVCSFVCQWQPWFFQMPTPQMVGGSKGSELDPHKLPSWSNTKHGATFIQVWRVRQFSLVSIFHSSWH